MKRNIINLLVILVLFASCGEKGLKIEGEVLNSKAKTISLWKLEGAKKTKLDEVDINDNRFTISVNLDERSIVGLFLDNELTASKEIVAKEGEYAVVIDCEKLQNQFEERKRNYKLTEEYKVSDYENESHKEGLEGIWFKKIDAAKSESEKKRLMAELKGEYKKCNKKFMDYWLAKVKDNSDIYFGLQTFTRLYEKMDQKDRDDVMKALSVKFSDHPIYLWMDRTSKLKTVKVNEPALDFKLKDIDGKDVALSDFKGKVVILDFWASWCKPCRAKNPELVKLYNKYKGQGLEIIGVSLDANKDAWKSAIEKDKLSWTNLSSLKAWNCDVATSYNVSAVPAVFIIDRKGIVREKKFKGPNLEEKIRSLIKQ